MVLKTAALKMVQAKAIMWPSLYDVCPIKRPFCALGLVRAFLSKPFYFRHGS